MNTRNEEEDYKISDVVSKLIYLSDIYAITDPSGSINTNITHSRSTAASRKCKMIEGCHESVFTARHLKKMKTRLFKHRHDEACLDTDRPLNQCTIDEIDVAPKRVALFDEDIKVRDISLHKSNTLRPEDNDH